MAGQGLGGAPQGPRAQEGEGRSKETLPGGSAGLGVWRLLPP